MPEEREKLKWTIFHRPKRSFKQNRKGSQIYIFFLLARIIVLIKKKKNNSGLVKQVNLEVRSLRLA
jgi:hypothetical protein